MTRTTTTTTTRTTTTTSEPAAGSVCRDPILSGRLVFGLGANLGDREETLRRALEEIRGFVASLRVASLYRTAPVLTPGVDRSPLTDTNQGDYFNTVAAGRLREAISCRTLLERLKALEKRAGRHVAEPGLADPGLADPGLLERDAPRPLDIDVLLAGSRVVDLPALGSSHARSAAGWPGEIRIPHPRLRERRFVLEPLAELAPDLTVPPDGRTPIELLAELAARDGPEQEVERVGWC